MDFVNFPLRLIIVILNIFISPSETTFYDLG